jgi:hypothetical protein
MRMGRTLLCCLLFDDKSTRTAEPRTDRRPNTAEIEDFQGFDAEKANFYGLLRFLSEKNR